MICAIFKDGKTAVMFCCQFIRHCISNSCIMGTYICVFLVGTSLLLNKMLQQSCEHGTYWAWSCFTPHLSSGLSSIAHAVYGVTVHDLHG